MRALNPDSPLCQLSSTSRGSSFFESSPPTVALRGMKRIACSPFTVQPLRDHADAILDAAAERVWNVAWVRHVVLAVEAKLWSSC